MSFSTWDIFFEEVSRELGVDSTFFKERFEVALERFVEDKAAQSLGLLSIEEGWILEENILENEPIGILEHVLDANPSTLRYLYSRVSSSQVSSTILALQTRYPNEFITPSHIDAILH